MLDTNIASDLIRNPAGRAAERARAAGEAICVSVIVAAELRYGCARKGSARLTERVEQFLAVVPVLPLAVPADGIYGQLRCELEQAGTPIGGNDLLIAAHARAVGAVMVTANIAEFQRVPGLDVENWMM
jgi:tRNA(fMet)-specific endonuclease VapC